MGESGEVSLVDLAIGQAVLNEKLSNLKQETTEKHIENKKDFRILKTELERNSKELLTLKIKLASYSAAGGVVTAVVLRILDHYWK
jgi:hypothetical protein